MSKERKKKGIVKREKPTKDSKPLFKEKDKHSIMKEQQNKIVYEEN